MSKEWTEKGYDEWNRLGFESDYAAISVRTKTISPPWDAESLLSQGFMPKGSLVAFTGKNGYENERKLAELTFKVGEPLTVISCKIGDSSSTYTFEEKQGKWNTVMFEPVQP